MVLNSLRFAAFFTVFMVILLLLPKKLRRPWLFIGNCAFYLSWEHSAFILLFLSSLMIWACGLAAEKSGRKKIFLILPVLWNILLLAVFKYTGLIGSVLSRAGIRGFSTGNLIMPLGISFYTLRCISYMADIFRGRLSAEKDPFSVFTYVSFFPQIISGPIERPGNFFRELAGFETKQLRDFERIRDGFLLFVWGLFQKLILAERLSVISSTVFSAFETFGFWEILIASLAYTLQIYCDFAGYSDMSRGISTMMGFAAMRNFRRPYLAAGIKNFWRRWHISLTSWLTDHIYIPLGGSRKGLVRKYLNIILVFLVSGMWHGSTLNFIFWGMLHAAYQIAEDLWNRTGRKLPARLLRIIMLAEVNFAWIFFNAGGLNRGFRIIRQMFSRFTLPASWEFGLITGNWVVLLLGLGILLAVDILQEKGIGIRGKVGSMPLPVRWMLILGLFWTVILLGIYGVGYDTSGFIYAQF